MPHGIMDQSSVVELLLAAVGDPPQSTLSRCDRWDSWGAGDSVRESRLASRDVFRNSHLKSIALVVRSILIAVFTKTDDCAIARVYNTRSAVQHVPAQSLDYIEPRSQPE